MTSENKAKFVEGLETLYLGSANPLCITGIKISKDENILRVYISDDAYYEVSIWGDNTHAIFRDFAKFLSNYKDYPLRKDGDK